MVEHQSEDRDRQHALVCLRDFADAPAGEWLLSHDRSRVAIVQQHDIRVHKLDDLAPRSSRTEQSGRDEHGSTKEVISVKKRFLGSNIFTRSKEDALIRNKDHLLWLHVARPSAEAEAPKPSPSTEMLQASTAGDASKTSYPCVVQFADHNMRFLRLLPRAGDHQDGSATDGSTTASEFRAEVREQKLSQSMLEALLLEESLRQSRTFADHEEMRAEQNKNQNSCWKNQNHFVASGPDSFVVVLQSCLALVFRVAIDGICVVRKFPLQDIAKYLDFLKRMENSKVADGSTSEKKKSFNPGGENTPCGGLSPPGRGRPLDVRAGDFDLLSPKSKTGAREDLLHHPPSPRNGCGKPKSADDDEVVEMPAHPTPGLSLPNELRRFLDVKAEDGWLFALTERSEVLIWSLLGTTAPSWHPAPGLTQTLAHPNHQEEIINSTPTSSSSSSSPPTFAPTRLAVSSDKSLVVLFNDQQFIPKQTAQNATSLRFVSLTEVFEGCSIDWDVARERHRLLENSGTASLGLLSEADEQHLASFSVYPSAFEACRLFVGGGGRGAGQGDGDGGGAFRDVVCDPPPRFPFDVEPLISTCSEERNLLHQQRTNATGFLVTREPMRASAETWGSCSGGSGTVQSNYNFNGFA
eukprot:g4751.t1